MKGSVTVNITTTDEAVWKAAASCPDAKRVLEVLFPDVFSPEFKAPAMGASSSFFMNGGQAIAVRNCGSLKDQGWYLASVPSYVWEIVRDSEDILVLVCKRAK